MSREIKFRCWDNKENRYVRIQNLNFVDNQPSSVSYHKKGHKGFTNTRYPNFILEQYTGIKDKNGKEIYEGDRIKIEGSDTIYTVEYGRGVWVARFGDESGDNICLFHYVQKDTVLYAEVIGNIHENPELIA